ncbi:hypothetical protein [Haloechinothrix sp. LS1_15]|uniref:hypothetical protein n=1 Tax=Haloechinothrix sp. LS1_15 TaxID=2652248 RepID=UPI0029477CA2|nr:hypothetical protein [Haloechinothrix sp. LS1_15]MDV6013500.1 C4-dicarboxylate ABC transporter substrate-binding protein [Haloechinothrix sp. LS1_15]
MTTGVWGRRRRHGLSVLPATITAALVLGACTGPGSQQESAGGPGVPPEASPEEYQEALADMEPVELVSQTSSGPGSVVSAATEAYAEVLEEWSGGKVTLDIAYNNSVAEPGEIGDALADGRLDMSYVPVLYDPSRYPANNALIDATFLGEQSPVVGTLQTNAAFLEAAFDSPEIMEEYTDNDMYPVLPYAPSDRVGMACTEQRTELEDMSGAQARIAAHVHAGQVEALGMSPVSLDLTEMYEALQRGVADCAVANLWIADMTGILPVASEYIIDSEVGMAKTPYGIAMSMATWEQLPLAAQQLLHDKRDVFLTEMFREGVWQGVADGLSTIDEAGASVSELSPDARAALESANEEILAGVRDTDALADGNALVSELSDSLDVWYEIVTEELGYSDEVGYDGFAEWYAENEVDLEPFIDRLYDEILDEHRPEE